MKNPEDSSKKINVRLFRKIQRAIRKEQGAFEMAWWADKQGGQPESKEHPCFTTACMAGWAVFEEDGKLPKKRESYFDYVTRTIRKRTIVNEKVIPKKAIEALGITAAQGSVLFTKLAWPSEMRERSYPRDGNRNGKSDAENACEVIDRFLAAGGIVDWYSHRGNRIDLKAFE